MIDLHVHSNYSDGFYEPAQVMKNAVRDGLKAVALCDHDCVWGLAEAKRTAKEIGIEFIPGVELTVSVENDKDHAGEIHMLGLFVEPSAHLEDIHARIKTAKNDFSEKLAAAFRKHYGISVFVEDMRKEFHGAISMGAFTQYMLTHGMIKEFKERKVMMKQLIASGKMTPKPEFGISAQEAIDAIHGAGGLAILAHPYRMDLNDQALYNRIKEYKGMGLDGLECYYKNYKKDKEADCIKKSLQMASILGLLISGGSDYHSDTKKGRFAPGDGVSDQVLADLKQARMVKSATVQRQRVANCGRVYE